MTQQARAASSDRGRLLVCLSMDGGRRRRANDGGGRPPPARPPHRTDQLAQHPHRLKWTFNLDLSWGTFGFADTLFADAEPGTAPAVRDRWFEGLIKPALSLEYTLPGESHVFGKASGVGERTYGSLPSEYGLSVASFEVEDLAVGWKSGTSISRASTKTPSRSRSGACRTRSATVSWCSTGGRRRQPRRVLDQRAPGVEDGCHRPLLAQRAHRRGVLPREERTARPAHRRGNVGRELRMGAGRGHDARRRLPSDEGRRRRRARPGRDERPEPARVHRPAHEGARPRVRVRVRPRAQRGRIPVERVDAEDRRIR